MPWLPRHQVLFSLPWLLSAAPSVTLISGLQNEPALDPNFDQRQPACHLRTTCNNANLEPSTPLGELYPNVSKPGPIHYSLFRRCGYCQRSKGTKSLRNWRRFRRVSCSSSNLWFCSPELCLCAFQNVSLSRSMPPATRAKTPMLNMIDSKLCERSFCV